MRSRRFRVDDLSPDRLTIGGAEAHHALHVLRLGVGDPVIVFDGHGVEADGRIVDASHGEITVEIESSRRQAARSLMLTIAAACPKGERADWMIEKCAELGVHAFWPVECAHSQVSPGAGKIERWRRKAGEAAKQSGRAHVMEVRVCATLKAILGDGVFQHRFYADLHPRAIPMLDALEAGGHLGPDASMIVFIGPERGWSDDERAMFDEQGIIPISLGDHALRVETAGVACAVICLARDATKAT